MALRDRRHQMGLSQQAFADVLGVPRLWVVTVESGRGNPTFTRLLEVARRTGLVLLLDDPNEDDSVRSSVPVDLDALLASWGPTGEK
jgi:transcriptional regulator with XRE-family HTH domain